LDIDVFNITNRGAAQQPLGSANQINSANYGPPEHPDSARRTDLGTLAILEPASLEDAWKGNNRT
jgi:hypothetical protein